MAFETKQMKTVSPVYDEDDMISKENLPYLMDDFLQLLEIEQSENNFTTQNDGGGVVVKPAEDIRSDGSLDEVRVNDNLSCLTCNASCPSQLILDRHLSTHDDNTLLSAVSVMKTEPPSIDDDDDVRDEQLRSFTSRNGGNRSNSIGVARPTVCCVCDEIIDDYRHCDDVHVEKSPGEPKELPTSDERVEETLKKESEEQEVVEDVSSSDDEREKTTENEQRLKTNDAGEYKTLINRLAFQDRFVGRINRANLIGPYFWKSFLLDEKLVRYVQPKQFQGKLKLAKCKTCVKVFSRPMTPRSKSHVPLQSTANNKHTNNNNNNNNNGGGGGGTAANNDGTWKITCQECSLVYHTLYEYSTHVQRHLNYSDHCNACLFDAVGN